MKILHIGPIFPNSSSGHYNSMIGLAKGQVSRGCQVAILPSQPTRLTKEDIPKNIGLLPGPKKRHLNPWKLSREWIKIIKQDFGKPDVVNFHSVFIPFHCALAQLFREKDWPYVVTPRGPLSARALRVKSFKKKIGRLLFDNHFIKTSRAILALCKNEAKDIQTLYPDSKVFIMPNGIDESLLSLTSKLRAKKLNGFCEKKDLVIGFLGRIDVYHKGIDLLLSALKVLQCGDLGKNIRLLMIGPFSKPSDESQVKKLINSLKFPDRVMLTGPQYGDDKWEWLMVCDVFVHTSRYEGMPMAVLEAMTLGKPCLVTPGSNMQDIISACKGGWLCEESVDSIANTIGQIEPDELLKRGINARNYAKEHLTWSIVARQYMEKITKILNIKPLN